MLTETVTPQKKYLLDSPVPTLSDIILRMSERFGQAKPLVKELVYPCAEVAERILYQVLSESSVVRQVRIRMQRRNGKMSKPRLTGYTCYSCGCNTLRIDYKFCPGCGKQLQWL